MVPTDLVYEGAITKNEQGRVNIRAVGYNLHGIAIAANLYTPAGYEEGASFPAVVVAHPNGGVKEQVAGLYAQRLAEAGYVTMAADAAFQGASGGEPRNVDRPSLRSEDIRGMVDFVSAYPRVDPKRIGALGICGGGGYTLEAAKTDKRIRAVATLSMFNSGRVRRLGFLDAQRDSVQERLLAASQARANECKGTVTYAGNVDFDALDEEKISAIPTDLYREGMLYYGKTHRHPNSTFHFTEASLLELMSWDATDHLDLVNVPLLLVAGEKADTLYMSRDACEKATGTDQRELFLIPGATHIQTYFVPEYVDMAVAKFRDFFGTTL